MDETAKLDDPSFADSSFADPGSVTSAGLEARATRLIEEGRFARDLLQAMEQVIVGQRYLLERLLVGLLANGHVLLEGVPGLAKTLAVKTLAQAASTLSFHRIQFTPDLLPADVVGTQIYNPQSGEFTIKKGPIFANLVLADEINRAPAKVQSALLEAMQEKQVTIGEQTLPAADEPFLVLATQNPIEQEGTYPLARGPGRPLHAQAQARLSERATRSARSSTAWRARRRPPPSSAVARRRRRSSRRAQVDRRDLRRRQGQATTSSTSSSRPATRRPRASISRRYIQYGASPRATIS